MTIIPSSSSAAVHVSLLAVLSAATLFSLYKSRRGRIPPPLSTNPPKLIFLSETGTSEALARRLLPLLSPLSLLLLPAALYDPEDLPTESLVVIVASTWQDNRRPFLLDWLAEAETDFRAGSLLLRGCRFAAFGVGSSEYVADNAYNSVARDIHRRMRALGAVEVVGLGLGDVSGPDLDRVFDEWARNLVRVLNGGSEGDRDEVAGGSEGDFDLEEEDDDDDEVAEEEEVVMVDLEDVAGKAPKRGETVRERGKGNGGKEMVTPVIRANLEKQGYKIIGSHSGVKICRWTKAQLRGRGGCYKHSFYGIESHRCMEATPSLACANKCVFCWRHHTNPVAKSWQWKMDDPLDIVNSAIEQHTKMIKQMKGVPGVKPERLTEGLTPRHCALSLVGEPIMYPEINTLVDELHRRRISTFLVTNAQFPDKIKMLKPITQLYVSVDAATKDSLKAIDRPLFSDFWERFLDSLKALQEKQQRTVYRLTLVKGWNVEDLDAYSSLFSIGNPDFVEIKGVTYCGSSATSKLTMENVPWHTDVKAFSEALARKSNGRYEVACEHVHSCCVLLARVDKFKINGQWFTWIDYEKFHDLVASGKSFNSKNYMAATPAWAVYGADEGGFDPAQSRYKKERHHKAK